MVKLGILCNTARSTFSIKFGFIQVNINGFLKLSERLAPVCVTSFAFCLCTDIKRYMNRTLEFPWKLEFLPYKIYKNPSFQVSFWLDPHAVPARVALGVTTLLTMSTQTASINSALPPVAYTKAIDVWQVSGNPHQILAVSHYICLLTDMCTLHLKSFFTSCLNME